MFPSLTLNKLEQARTNGEREWQARLQHGYYYYYGKYYGNYYYYYYYG